MPPTSLQQYTYWSMTWNNPDDTAFVLIRNPNSKYVRECVWTLEEGEQGTPHIQAWIRLQRNQTLAFVKKLYPGGHFKYIAKDEYNENTHTYAQKNDETTRGAHIITLNDPIPNVESVYYRVCERVLDHTDWDSREGPQPWGKYFSRFGANLPKGLVTQIKAIISEIQIEMVASERGLEKIFTSVGFDRLTKFLPQTLFRLWSDKQTNKQVDEKESTLKDTTNADEDTCSQTSSGVLEGVDKQSQGSDDHEESSCSSDEGPDEGTSDESGQEDDFSE